jgi:hypothetical protein
VIVILLKIASAIFVGESLPSSSLRDLLDLLDVPVSLLLGFGLAGGGAFLELDAEPSFFFPPGIVVLEVDV